MAGGVRSRETFGSPKQIPNLVQLADEGGLPFYVRASDVRRSDKSAKAAGEASKADFMMDGVTPVPEDIAPLEMNVVGNYAVQISWPDGFSQVATFAQIAALEQPWAAHAGEAMCLADMRCSSYLDAGDKSLAASGSVAACLAYRNR